MPTYEYECKKCNYRFEAFQQIKDKPLKKCPNCKASIRRLISAGAGFIFKGSGFYATDYRSAEYKDKQKKEKAQTTSESCPSSSNSQKCKSCPANKAKND